MWPIYSRAVEATVGKHLSVKQTETLDVLLKLLIDEDRGH
jgi:hypothetical protein